MGKLIPQNLRQADEQEAGSSILLNHSGPMQGRVKELVGSLREIEEVLDLDELDRLARRHARVPASGSPEALDALAVVVRYAPELFSHAEVNLHPERMEGLADRDRALSLLSPVITRLSDLVHDSQLEQGDEVVELLTVGYKHAAGLDPARIYSNDRLAQAMEILSAYQKRVAEEGAHRSAETKDQGKPSKKK